MQSRVLIITDDQHDANLLAHVLSASENDNFYVEWQRQLSSSIKRIHKADIDAIVVDLLLPDSYGIDTFNQLIAVAPYTPIVILSESEDEALAIEAMRLGAQGYLSQGSFVSQLVPQTLRNIIQRKTLEESLYKENARAETALNAIGEAVICTDLLGNIDYLNIAAEQMTGWHKAEARGLPIQLVFNTMNRDTRKPPAHNPIMFVIEKNKSIALHDNTLLIQRDGLEIPIENSISPIRNGYGDITGAVVVFRNVSAVLNMRLKMEHIAQHDYLTNLPNRLLLNDRITQAIALAKRDGKQLAVFFLDLDKFKHINDSLGHDIGDQLLQSVAARLKNCVRESDTVSRQGGDEFVILLAADESALNAGHIAEKMLAELAMPYLIADCELHITASIGISIYPEDGLDAESLIKNADEAMYKSKQSGRNRHQFFKGA